MAEARGATETADYQVEVADGPIEMRLYGPRIMAEVTATGTRSQAIKAGFRVLADYIFGANDGGTRLAMTTPVTQVPGQTVAMTAPVTQWARDDTWLVQFMMPQDRALDSLPNPHDPAIRFVEMPPTRQIVLRFSGSRDTRTLVSHEGTLRSWARGKAITVTAGPFYYFYDPPWTLPWNRRNEVAFVVH